MTWVKSPNNCTIRNAENVDICRLWENEKTGDFLAVRKKENIYQIVIFRDKNIDYMDSVFQKFKNNLNNASINPKYCTVLQDNFQSKENAFSVARELTKHNIVYDEVTVNSRL